MTNNTSWFYTLCYMKKSGIVQSLEYVLKGSWELFGQRDITIVWKNIDINET